MDHSYYVVNLESVDIEKAHPYTLIFKGYIPTFGTSFKQYTFKYDGDIIWTDASMSDSVKEQFANQMQADYGCGRMFNLNEVRKILKTKHQYEMLLM